MNIQDLRLNEGEIKSHIYNISTSEMTLAGISSESSAPWTPS
jgi:hypothetical protein